jgi:hypothetical protein
VIVSPDQASVPIYRRSPFQVALLLFSTGGLYIFWWAYFTRRWCAGTLERTDQPLAKAIALIIPIFNLFLLYDLGQMIDGVTFRAQLEPPRYNLGLIGIGSVIFSVVANSFHNGLIALSFLTFMPLAYLHAYTYRAEVAISGDAAAATKLNVVELLAVAVGLVWQAVLVLGIIAHGWVVFAAFGLIAAGVVLWQIRAREVRAENHAE